MATKATFAIEGQNAEQLIGRFGFFEGTYSGVLSFIQQKGLSNENIVEIGYNSTTGFYFLFYWK